MSRAQTGRRRTSSWRRASSVRTERHPSTAHRTLAGELWRAGLGVEQPHQAVDARRGDARSVGAEGEVLDASGRSGQYGHALTALHIPYLRESVRTRQHDPRALGSKSTCGHGPSASIVRTTLPRAQSQILTRSAGQRTLGRGHEVAVGAERDVGEVGPFSARQHSDHPPGRRSSRLPPVCRGQILAIRAEGDRVDVTVVSDPPKLLAGRRIPRPDRRRPAAAFGLAPAAEGDRRTIGAHSEGLERENVGRRSDRSQVTPRLQIPDRHRGCPPGLLGAALRAARHHALSVRHELRRG